MKGKTKGSPRSKTTPYFGKQKSLKSEGQRQLVYSDIRLQHLNPGYIDKDARDFLEHYKSKEEIVLETFKYNNSVNEENFCIEIASIIAGGNSITILFRQYNRSHNGLLNMY